MRQCLRERLTIVRAMTELQGKRWTSRKGRDIVQRGGYGLGTQMSREIRDLERGPESYKSREMNERHRESKVQRDKTGTETLSEICTDNGDNRCSGCIERQLCRDGTETHGVGVKMEKGKQMQGAR